MKTSFLSLAILVLLGLSACSDSGKNKDSDSALNELLPLDVQPTVLSEAQKRELLKKAEYAQRTNRYNDISDVDYVNMMTEYDRIVEPLYNNRNTNFNSEAYLMAWYEIPEIESLLNEATAFEYVLNYAAGSGIMSDSLIQRWNEISMSNSKGLAQMNREKETFRLAHTDTLKNVSQYYYHSDNHNSRDEYYETNWDTQVQFEEESRTLQNENNINKTHEMPLDSI